MWLCAMNSRKILHYKCQHGNISRILQYQFLRVPWTLATYCTMYLLSLWRRGQRIRCSTMMMTPWKRWCSSTVVYFFLCTFLCAFGISKHIQTNKLYANAIIWWGICSDFVLFVQFGHVHMLILSCYNINKWTLLYNLYINRKYRLWWNFRICDN